MFPSGSWTMKSCPPQASFLQPLREGDARRYVLDEERLHILNLDERHVDALAILREHRLVDKLEVHARSITRHRPVEWRLAVQEINRESKRVAKEFRRRSDCPRDASERAAWPVFCRRRDETWTPLLHGCCRWAVPFRLRAVAP